ncbi:hypothetical protein HBH92_080920 [Parastagonospora nodorum]|nr:hypothetical protein HBH92_080920 [Parastagonospora nodorum]KAH4440337.1 hypothetical protein HBH93_080420 [Parastagonospora nodorum]KAH4451611.1 hypothetical protein HBH91_108650 [Parastagonospora nodorum]KAH4508991.1 hypothetical protein HBH89_066000 [Parastagonospora nodorum]KAH4547653.1 hypothetical protein HBH85_066440 [Parastagonospora nodorum]
MADMIPHHNCHLLLLQLPHLPIVRLRDLNDGGAVRAASQYPTTVSDNKDSTTRRGQFTKLIQAHERGVDSFRHELIMGTGANAKEQIAISKEITKSTTNTRSDWIGTISWLQKFVAGEVQGHDFQVLLNNYS